MKVTLKHPTPKRLLEEAKAEQHQHPYDLSKYGAVIDTLFQKEFSYAKIAKWISARLGGTIDRGQVYYVYQNWLKKRQAAQSRAALEELQEEATALGNGIDEAESADPELEEFLKEGEARLLNAEADKEDAQRRRKGRKRS